MTAYLLDAWNGFLVSWSAPEFMWRWMLIAFLAGGGLACWGFKVGARAAALDDVEEWRARIDDAGTGD